MEWKLLWVVLVLGGWWSHCDGCWDQERSALMHLKPYFSQYIPDVSKWGEGEKGSNCCQWERVECDISTGRVTGLFLDSSNFENQHGFFYDPIANDQLDRWAWEREEWYLNVSLFLPFQELNTLSLSANRIAGSVDHQGFEKLSTKLKKLEILDLSYNNLSDSILTPLTKLSSLKLLNLAMNQFTGSNLSKEKGGPRLGKLEKLDLSGNAFNNSILSVLGLLSNLKSLDISSNALEGAIHMQELNALSNLEELFMSDNQVTDLVPSQDNKTQLRLMNLKTLYLYGNPFNGSRLASLGRLLNLKSLSLSVGGPDFTGSVDLTELNTLTHLEDLHLYCYNTFSPTATDRPCKIPLQSLRLFPSLNNVDLRGFDIEGTVRTSQKLNPLTHLEYLSLNCDYTYSPTATDNPCKIPLQSLRLFPSLKTVDLRGFDIEGTVRTSQNEWHSNFTNLEELHVEESSLPTNFLGSIRQFISLKRLILRGCETNGSMSTLKGLCGMKNLQELTLWHNDLKGSLPECFSNLTSLYRLDLSVNQFFGNISVLESLTALKTLDLSSNQFSGNIHALKSLTSLEILFLSYNQFSGNIHALKSLTSLRQLWLSDNQLRIPISLGPLFNLSELKTIYADNNIIYVETQIPSSAPRFQLEDIRLSCCGDVGSFPEFLYHQHDLQSLDLSNVFFKGNRFPNWVLDNNKKLERLLLTNSSLSGPLQLPLASHIHLSDLDVSNNFFNGNIPTEIGEKLPSLEFLKMSKTHSIGSIPSSFGHMTSLIVLELSNNKLEGKIFSGISKLPNLKELKLDGNFFSRVIPNLLSKTPFLLALDVSNNKLSGKIPRWMGRHSSLQRIIMSNNHLQGTIPIEFCQLDSLELLDLSVNNISGSIPSCFNPPHITQVHLAKNRLRGSLPNALRNSSTLVTLDISDNFLSGSIPSWIGGLSDLSYLLLSNNNFQGEIPIELCNLNYSSVIDLSHNNLSGRIPPCLKLTTLGDAAFIHESMIGPGAFSLNEPIGLPIKNVYNSYRGIIIPMVSGIDLSCNKLVGEIPHQIGNLHKMLVLNLSHNSLTGPIPPTFANLKQIESLDLSYNKLSGNIPSQLVGLTFLSSFNVSFNNLFGKTPPRVKQFGTFDESSYKGNPFLCGEPLPECADTGPSPPKPSSSTDNDEDYGFIDMREFHVTFIVSYTIMLLAVVIVSYINPYWRRVWFYHAEKAATFCYYLVLDNVLQRRFY